MSRPRIPIAAAGLLLTFAWLLGPEPAGSAAALWPSLLAVGLAFVTRNIHLSLFLGAFSGALLIHGGKPWLAFHDLLIGRLIPSLTDRWNICVVVFTLLMGGFVEVLNRNGGMAALTARVLGRGGTPRRAGMGAYLMGWVVFFDGLASSMLVGKTLRPVADRAGLSREKLAFIVDSTSSPIAGLSLLSTWVAYEMSVIGKGFANTGIAGLADTEPPFSWLVVSLPYRFYNWFMLLLVFLVVWRMRDWGPMLDAERSAAARQLKTSEHPEAPRPTASPLLALVPLAVLVLGVFGGLFVGGGGLDMTWSFANLVQAMGRADAAAVFVVATAAASGVAIGLTALGRGVGRGEHGAEGPGATEAFLHGMQQMFLPTLILVFAWMLNAVIKELKTADYLVTLLGAGLNPAWLPALVFLLACGVSFSTGTSWGTMAIVMPLAIPLAVHLTGYSGGGGASGTVLSATVGAVLAGAVFGDHCSPISDTTIVSAFSSGCDVMAHVRTQMPYALVAGAVAAVVGYLPAGYGVHPALLLALGSAALWGLVRHLGQAVR